jgi:hypothetical protein
MINTFENIILSSAMTSRTGRGDAPVSTTTTTTTSTSTTTTTSTSTTCPPSTIVSNGLTLYNRCCSMTGSVWYDVSGNGNHALVSGSALVQSGSLGLAFNGTNNYLTYPANLTATPSSSWTMQWYGTFYNSGSGINNMDLFGKTTYLDGWDTVYGPDFFGSQSISFRDVTGQDNFKPFTNTPSVKLLFTMTVDSNPDAPRTAYFVNTTNFGTGSQFSVVSPFNTASGSLTFGFNIDTDATYFKGTMSDLIIYNRILTPAEVTTNYNTLSTVDACF